VVAAAEHFEAGSSAHLRRVGEMFDPDLLRSTHSAGQIADVVEGIPISSLGEIERRRRPEIRAAVGVETEGGDSLPRPPFT